MKQAELDGRRMPGPSCEDEGKMETKENRAVHRVREAKSQLGFLR